MVPNTVQKGGQVARQFTDLVVRQRLRSALRRSPRCGYAAASPTSRSSAQRRPARRKQPTTIPTPALLPAANDVEHQLIQPPGWRHDAWHADAHHQGGNQSSRPTRNQAMKCVRHTTRAAYHHGVSHLVSRTSGLQISVLARRPAGRRSTVQSQAAVLAEGGAPRASQRLLPSPDEGMELPLGWLDSDRHARWEYPHSSQSSSGGSADDGPGPSLRATFMLPIPLQATIIPVGALTCDDEGL